MKQKKIDAVEVWKEFEDVLAPRLKLLVLDRAVYSHLFRHTRLEGKSRLRFSIFWLAKNMGVRGKSVRTSVRRLIHKGALRLIERSNLGHLVEVRLPAEVCAPRVNQIAAYGQDNLPAGAILDEMDFMRTRPLRQAIHARELGVCFYCLRQIPSRAHCLDHVVPLAEGGSNSYRNLVSCCMDCNSQKSNSAAEDFLRELYREGRLSAKDLSACLDAVQALAAGKLRPQIFSGEDAEGGRS
jgi:5-methylcytosine-specific restriction endonuclease McrA